MNVIFFSKLFLLFSAISLLNIINILQPDKKSTGIAVILQKEKWTPFFDGKTLKGWHSIPGGQWKVENGMIIGTSPKSDERHGLLVTDKSYKNFKVQVKYKAITGNRGLYFRIDEVGGTVGVNGFQAEIDPEKDAGGLYETGGREWVVQPKPEDVKK